MLGCFRQFKVTNSKANHNEGLDNAQRAAGVSDSSKLQIQKQITTVASSVCKLSLVFPIVQSYKFKSKSQQDAHSPLEKSWCFRQFKVTNSKANHNATDLSPVIQLGVSDSSKLQIQKQITTLIKTEDCPKKVFPIVQSYKFKSKWCRNNRPAQATGRCFRWFGVINSTANGVEITVPPKSLGGVSDGSEL